MEEDYLINIVANQHYFTNIAINLSNPNHLKKWIPLILKIKQMGQQPAKLLS